MEATSGSAGSDGDWTALNWYALLEIGRDASDQEVKAAYRRLARVHHPDRNPGDHEAAERFKRIAEAYQGLSDPFRRMRHDIDLRAREEAVRHRASQMEDLAAAHMAWELRREMASHPRVHPRSSDPTVPGWYQVGPQGEYWQPNPFYGRPTTTSYYRYEGYEVHPEMDARPTESNERIDGIAAVAFDILELWFGKR